MNNETDVQNYLRSWKSQVYPVIDANIAQFDSAIAKVCYYHFGWTDADGCRTLSATAGKALRPALVLAAGTTGTSDSVTRENLLKASASVEMIHQWSLLEDDIIDNDHLRRGRASAWAAFGIPRTLLAGDTLQAQAVSLMLSIEDYAVQEHVQHFLRTIRSLVKGQDAEQRLGDHGTARHAQYAVVATNKTGALLGTCMALGARLRDASPEQADRLSQAGEHLGIAWQAMNDLEDIWATSELTGKQHHGDEEQAAETLPIILGREEHEAVPRAINGNPCGEASVAHYSRTLGVRRAVEHFSDQHLQLALNAMRSASLPEQSEQDLTMLFRFIIENSRNKLSPIA